MYMKKILLSVITFFFFTVFVNAQNSAPYWSLTGNSNTSTTSKLGTTNGVSLRFYTNNVQRMIIGYNSGFIGIGTNSPTEKLHVNSASGANPFRAQVDGSTKLLVHSGGGVSIGSSITPPANGLYISGSVGISTTSYPAKLNVNNDATFGVGIGVYSSARNFGVQAFGTDTIYGVGVEGTGNDAGVRGIAGVDEGVGTYGYSYSGMGASGASTYGFGVRGFSSHRIGASGQSQFGTGFYGYSEQGNGGEFESALGRGITASTINGDYAGVFYGAVLATEGYVTSDKNLKTNIHEFDNAINIINKLKPQSYEFKNDAKYASLNLPKGNHYGLLAQDLEEVLPNLVSEAPHQLIKVKPVATYKPIEKEKSSLPAIEKKEVIESIQIKAVNYIELIPVIIKAMQEQESKMQEYATTIKEQNTKIEDLTKLVNKLSLNNTTLATDKLTGAYLSQSNPNPNSTITRISYNIPTGFSKAELVISNEDGKKVKQIQLNKSGLIEIDTSKLAEGTYFYTLIVNGTSVDTKKMVVIK